MNLQPETVYIVDDDPEVCRAVGRLVRGAGYDVREFNSAHDFLLGHEPDPPGCLLLDLTMPDLDGLELQRCLAASGCHRPIVFLTANYDVQNTVRAMKAGAVNFLTKPVDRDELMAALAEAFAVDAAERAGWEARNTIAGRLATLTPRERQVLEKVVAGRLKSRSPPSWEQWKKPSRSTGRASCRSCTQLLSSNSLKSHSSPGSRVSAAIPTPEVDRDQGPIAAEDDRCKMVHGSDAVAICR